MTENICSPYSSRYYSRLKDIFAFELTSLVGRLLMSKYPPKQKGKQSLNVGSSYLTISNWVNLDFFDPLSFFRKSKRSPNWRADLRHPLKCKDNYWSGVFCEHVLEHLTPLEVKKYCWRLRGLCSQEVGLE
jgi:hypothetical protein